MESVKKSIDNAASECDKAIGQLHTGRGNILRQTENLKTLGAKASKQLAAHYIESEEESPLLPEEENSTNQ